MPIVGSKEPISDLAIAQAIVGAGIQNSKRTPKGDPASAIRTVANFVAIALAESRGIPGNYNTVPPGHYGLWQISAHHFPNKDASKVDWKNPNVNAKFAVDVFERQGYGAWTVFTGGQYLGFLTRGKVAAEQALNAKYPGPLDDVKEGLAAAQAFANFLTDRKNWVRLGLFAAGFAIIVLGLIRVSGPVAAKAAKAMPVGKIVKAVK